MAFMNISTTAERWGLTVRRVQEMCKNGQIKGATRFGRAWMIPEDAEKPVDGRTRAMKERKQSEEKGFLLPAPRKNPFLIHTDLYNTAGTAEKVISSFNDYPETQKIVKAQFDYRRGDIEGIRKNVENFLSRQAGFYSTISAGILLSYCAIWEGDINLWRRAHRHIYEAPCKNDNERQIVDFWIAVVNSNILSTTNYPDWFTKGKFDCLPFDTLCSARAFYIKYLFISAHDLASGRIKKRNVEGLGLMRTLPYIIEPMISQARAEKTVILLSYLHLMASTIYHNLGEDDEANEHIDKALDLCLPDKLYGILVEYRGGLDTLLDDRLALRDEQALEAVREMHKKMQTGWLKLHNQLLERNLSSKLTIREREVAKLATFGLSNTEIASRLNIEVSSVKQYIFSVMNKVGANKRSELGLYI